MNANIMKKIFPAESKLREMGNCPFCTKLINETDFRDELSKKEFAISGLCQNCQDKMFGK